MLEVGTIAPDFTLQDQDGKDRTLSEFRGKKVILYFYPKDNTPGCTKEACSFRDYKSELESKNAVIIGVSKDSVASHQRFIEKQRLNFILLSDPEHKVLESYGAWGEKINYGKKSMGTIRSTFIISEKGVVEKIFPKVAVATHGEDVLKYLD